MVSQRHPVPRTRRTALAAIGTAFLLGGAVLLWAQGPPPMRRHRVLGTHPLSLVPATERPRFDSEHTMDVEGGRRHVVANGIPEHKVGRFPNRGNPNAVRPQRYNFFLPGKPQIAEKITLIHAAPSPRRGPPNMPFGIALNGVVMDPGTAEFWNGDPLANWNYEALGGAVPLGLDANYAHVQPSGAYHYHGLPTLLLRELGFQPGKHSPQVGWAADGFPVYALYGYKDANDPETAIVELKSSYRLKKGSRPAGARNPKGKYDGTFIQDYEFAEGIGDLDECSGRECKTPEFPIGTYTYFLTKKWPVIPRAFRGTPVMLRGPGPGPGGPGGPPPGLGPRPGIGPGPGRPSF